ncbi:MAG TPA: hypothetical protein VGZ52_03185 [Acidimicrobiales bacterium]|jgi:hypothetical protein|nr:hypothetical protein [Acidimicrobiales bacterium]
MPVEGERMLIPCEGGPGLSRLVHYPPPLEIEEGTDGVYVLDERTTPHGTEYAYVYVPNRM